MAHSLRTDQHCFRPVLARDPLVVRLRELSRLDEDLNLCFQRHCCQLRQLLHRYFRHFLQLSPTADEPWVWALLELAPTPAKAAKLAIGRIEKILLQCHIRRIDAQEILTAFRGPAFSVASGTIEAASEHTLLILPDLQLLRQQRLAIAHRIDRILDEFGTAADEMANQPRDVDVLLSLPGVGRLVTANLLAAAIFVSATRSITGHGSACNTTRAVGSTIISSAATGTVTIAPCAAWQIVSWRFSAQC